MRKYLWSNIGTVRGQLKFFFGSISSIFGFIFIKNWFPMKAIVNILAAFFNWHERERKTKIKKHLLLIIELFYFCLCQKQLRNWQRELYSKFYYFQNKFQWLHDALVNDCCIQIRHQITLAKKTEDRWNLSN